MSFALPKTPTEIIINFDKLEKNCTYDATIFLDTTSPHHKGEQTIDELLNDEHDFIPMKIKQEFNKLSIFNINTLNYVIHETDQIMQSDIEFRVIFTSGEQLLVKNSEVLPEFHARPVDYLNSHHRFLTFQYKNSKIYINKSHIKRITDL